MNLDIPSPDTDLVDTGILESRAFAELLRRLDEVFGLSVALDDLRLDDFRTARAIAALAAQGTRAV
jgi:acyl carrier protein